MSNATKKAATAAATARPASFEEACQILGIEPSLPEVAGLPEKHQKAIVAHYKLVIIAQALNAGWEPNWDDDDEWKYYPWFDLEKRTTAGSGFAFHAYDFAYTSSYVGSRLCFQSRELATYAGETFTDLYRDYFLIEG